MAEIVASPIVEVLLEQISISLLKGQGQGLFLGDNDDMTKLQSTLSTIRSVLEDAEWKSVRDKQVSNWLKKLKSAALEADDVVDELQIEELRRKALRQSVTLGAKVCEFFSPHNSIVFRYKMAHKIKRLTKRLDDIAEERKIFKLVEGSSSKKNLSIYQETHSVMMESYVYGRVKEKDEVIDLLVNTDNDKNVSILPIVGLGGMGKTTLAQFVYNDNRIKNHFELRSWVCVSQTFEKKTIIKDILQSISRDECNLYNLQDMQQKLRDNLSHKKFLLVMDDVWNEDEAQWKSVKHLFNGGKHGSKILVTTRSMQVARIMGTVSQPYQLERLSAYDSWALFRQMAFRWNREEETPRNIEIAKEIVTKYGGIPIVVKTLASIWGSTRGEEMLLSLNLNNEYIESVLKVLELSYNNLPSQVKQCFLYCSLFPKDFLLDKDRLIKLWIAEGLISSANEEGLISSSNKNANATRICHILSSTSFFEVGKTDYSGNLVSYKMHDLVHDLACYVAGDERCINEAGNKADVSLECRYMSVVTDNVYKGLTIPKKDYKSVKLRTFLASRSYFGGIVGVDWGLMSTRLRVLDLSFTSIEELPDTMDILKHLRFLDLSWTEIRTIPDSIISLQKLQALYLINCYQLQQLPQGIVFLTSLMHLDISGCYKLTCMPRGIGRLTDLRTLPTFIVGKERGRTIMELERLNQIRGKLQIDGLHCVKDVDEAVQAKLAEKTGLESLDLRWAWSASSSSSSSSSSSGDNTSKQENSFLACIKKISFAAKGSIPAKEEDVLERLQPPTYLKELRIIRYAGTRFPSWMMTTTTPLGCCLPNLVTIVLFDIKRCERLQLGHLPSLRLLSLYCMPDLVEWSTEPISTGSGVESIYPRLERLLITNCPKLATLPEGLFHLTKLWELQIERCPLLGIQSQRKIGGEWRSTVKEVDFVAQETERSSYGEEIEEELQE